MKSDRNIKISKFLSLALRNQPEKSGTTEPFLPSIRGDGLVKGRRHDVRLSESRQVAALAGGRRGRSVILRIASEQMNRGWTRVLPLSQRRLAHGAGPGEIHRVSRG
jgi:putative RNA 2'-phosphotransferase